MQKDNAALNSTYHRNTCLKGSDKFYSDRVCQTIRLLSIDPSRHPRFTSPDRVEATIPTETNVIMPLHTRSSNTSDNQHNQHPGSYISIDSTNCVNPAQESQDTRMVQKDIRHYFQPVATASSPSNPSPDASILSPKAEESRGNLSDSCNIPQKHKSPDSNQIPNSVSWHQPSIPRENPHTTPPIVSPSRNTLIDLSLVPLPLRLYDPHTLRSSNQLTPTSPSLSENSSILMSAALDTDGTFRKSVIMSMFERVNLGETDESYPMLGSSNRSIGRESKFWNGLSGQEALRGSRTNGDDTVIYFMPSPEMISALASPTAYLSNQDTILTPTSLSEDRTTAEAANVSSDNAESPLLLPRMSTKALKILGDESSSGTSKTIPPIIHGKFHVFIPQIPHNRLGTNAKTQQSPPHHPHLYNHQENPQKE